MATEELYNEIRKHALSLPRVSAGTKFGSEAWFVGKKFFAHCHKGPEKIYLEAKVGEHQVEHLTKGVFPHPDYAKYGWVRTVVKEDGDLETARSVLENSYRYMSITKVWLPRKKGLEKKIRAKEAQVSGFTLLLRRELGKKRMCVEVIPYDPFAPDLLVRLKTVTKMLRGL